MADLGIQINARGSNVSAQRRANNVVIEIDNSEAKAATTAALTAAQATAQIGADVRAEADAKLGEVEAALDGTIRTDTPAQGLSAEQQANARANGNIAPRAGQYFSDDLGLAGDGVTDDTARLQAVCNIPGAVVVLNPLKTYVVGDLIVADNVTIRGYTGRGYITVGGVDGLNTPRLQKKPGAQCVLNVNGKRGVNLYGIVIDGVDNSAPCISAGSSRMMVQDCRFINGSHGIGGAVDGGSVYTRSLHMRGAVIAANGTGIHSLVDSFIFETTLANNGVNLYGSAGSSSNLFAGVRFEWPILALGLGNNVRFIGTSTGLVGSNNFVGCQFDRGEAASIVLNYCSQTNFSGGWARRSNRSLSSDAADNTIVHIQNSAAIAFTAVNFNQGRDDSGGAVTTISPDYVVNFGAGCDGVVFSACTVPADNAFVSFARNVQNCSGLLIKDIPGIPDYCNDAKKVQMVDGRVYRDLLRQDVAAGATVTFSLKTRLPLIGTFRTNSFKIEVADRRADINTGVARDYWATLGLFMERESGNPAVGGLAVVSQSTAGYYGVGSGTIQVAVGNLLADGSGFDVTVTNTDTSSHRVEMVLVV